MPTPDVSRSMWYTDTPTIQDSFKDYLALLHSSSTTPNSPTEAVQHPGASARQKTSSWFTKSAFSPFATFQTKHKHKHKHIIIPKPELSHSLDLLPTTTSIHSPQQSLFGLEDEGSSPSEQSSNVSRSTNDPNGSGSYRRPLPKPPRESALRRTQSSASLTAISTRSLPLTLLLEVSEPNESRSPVSDNSHIHSRSPSMRKASQEFTWWDHELTDPQQIPPAPSSETMDLDSPPPSYSSIYFAQDAELNCITAPTLTAPST